MGQEEIINYLEKKGGWVSSKDIQRELKTSISSVMISLRRLFKFGEVYRRDVRGSSGYEWKAKDNENIKITKFYKP
jgi:predicted transcriptional regulator